MIRWSARAADQLHREVGAAAADMGPKQTVVADFFHADPSDISRWTRGQRGGGPIGRVADAIRESVHSAKGHPGSLLAALLVAAVEEAATLPKAVIQARLSHACRQETLTQADEDVAEMDLVAALETDDEARIKAALTAYLSASQTEIGWQLDCMIYARALEVAFGWRAV